MGGLSAQQLTFVIEDPIERANNCAKNVRPRTARLLRNEFGRARHLLAMGAQWEGEGCAEGSKQSPQCWERWETQSEVREWRERHRARIARKGRAVCAYIDAMVTEGERTMTVQYFDEVKGNYEGDYDYAYEEVQTHFESSFQHRQYPSHHNNKKGKNRRKQHHVH